MAKVAELVFIPESRVVTLSKRPKRVWTVLPLSAVPPSEALADFVPVHNKNAFLEEFLHDWKWTGDSDKPGTLRYYSRVFQSNCWIFVEY